MKTWLKNRPWIWIIAFFLFFMSAWTGLIVIAVRNSPPPFDAQQAPAQSAHES